MLKFVDCHVTGLDSVDYQVPCFLESVDYLATRFLASVDYLVKSFKVRGLSSSSKLRCGYPTKCTKCLNCAERLIY